MHADPMTCIHRQHGLCPDCQEEHDADPGAWLEFGRHVAGIARWEKFEAELAADRQAEETVAVFQDDEIPF